MSTMLVRHQVKDFEAWKTIYDEHGSVRRRYGLSEGGLYRDDGDPNMITAVLKADDLGRAREFAASPDLKETMGRAGVISQPEIWYANDA